MREKKMRPAPNKFKTQLVPKLPNAKTRTTLVAEAVKQAEQNPKKIWRYLLVGNEQATATKVACCGTCAILGPGGTLIRNTGRDILNNVLDMLEVPFFDPQITQETHGEEYDSRKHGTAEKIAREVADLLIYEVSPHTLAALTGFEIGEDAASGRKMIVIFTGKRDADGYPLFDPPIQGDTSELTPLMKAYLKETIKAGNNIRRQVVDTLKLYPHVKVAYAPDMNDIRMLLQGMINN
jgi:hypothetical protein